MPQRKCGIYVICTNISFTSLFCAMRKHILLDENTDHGDKQPIFESQFCPSLVKETLNYTEGSRKCHQRVFRMQKGFPQNRCIFSFFFFLLFFFSFFEMALGMGEGMYLVNECDQSTLCEFSK